MKQTYLEINKIDLYILGEEAGEAHAFKFVTHCLHFYRRFKYFFENKIPLSIYYHTNLTFCVIFQHNRLFC